MNRILKAVTVLAAALAGGAAVHAQATGGGRAAVRTTGQLDRDGTAIYSVYVASRNEELGEVLVAIAVPAGSRFLEALHRPQGVVYEGVQKDVVYWSMPSIAADTLVGPLVLRLKSDGSGTDLPASLHAGVAYQRPVQEFVDGPAAEGKLAPAADAGSVTFDQRGTLDANGVNGPVPLGDTGVILFIPEGAVDRRVTVSARRLPIDEGNLPQTDPPTWWCSLLEFSAEPRVAFTKRIALGIPTRRGVTPGVDVNTVATTTTNDWTKTPLASGSHQIGFGLGQGFGGRCATIGFQTVACGFQPGFGFGGFGGFGYVEQDNLRSTATGTKLTSTIGVSAAATVTNPPSVTTLLRSIQDGTSNTFR